MLRVDLDLQLVRNPPKTRPLYREADWELFRGKLREHFQSQPLNLDKIGTKAELDAAVDRLVDETANILNEIVPMSKPSKYSKRWWSKELSDLRKEYHKTQKQWTKTRQEDLWKEMIAAKKMYRRAVQKQKRDHWRGWLTEMMDRDIWSAAKFASEPGEQAGPIKMPALLDLRGQVQVNPGAKAKLLASSFFPDRPNHLRRRSSQTKHTLHTPDVTVEMVSNAITRAKPYSAPGSSGVPNVALQADLEFFATVLHQILLISLQLGHFPSRFRIFRTIVLRKPGKDNYSIPKAYRPIALEETMGKAMESTMATLITDMLEDSGALPEHHYGGRAGRSTTDPLLQLTQAIKDAWRVGMVASVLYLDVSQAFPNVAHARLLERMEDMGLAPPIVNWIESFLSERSTSLAFDDYVSDLVAVPTGVPQGSPLSVILYLIYSSGLLEIGEATRGKKDKIYGFIDDTAMLVVSKTIRENIGKLGRLADEGLVWARDSASVFDVAKYQLVHYTRRVDSGIDKDLPLVVAGTTIKPSESAKYLGVFIDDRLNFKEHAEYAVGKGVSATIALSRLANTRWGMPHKYVRRLFTGLVVPRMEYALPVWYSPVIEGDKRRKGSVGLATRLAKPQRIACKIAAGGLRSTATDALDYHAHILPTQLRLNLAAYKAAARLCTLPSSHPLAKTVQRCKRTPRFHRSPIHNLLAAFKDFQATWETIEVGAMPRTPPESISFIMDSSKEEAERRARRLPKEGTYIYSDGSGYKAGIGAAAWTARPDGAVSRRLHLDSEAHHTVFEAELTGAILAVDIIKSIPRLTRATILLDSQAALLALKGGKTKSGRYLVEEFHRQVSKLRKKRSTLQITMQWVPGHVGIAGNEAADDEAKQAAEGDSSPLHDIKTILAKPLPWSKSATIASFSKQTQHDWSSRWLASSTCRFLKTFDKTPPSAKTKKVYNTLSRPEASILTPPTPDLTPTYTG